ncbi:MAG: ABC transporter ATP-binding protein [Ilumatobacteraceae bacterium]
MSGIPPSTPPEPGKLTQATRLLRALLAGHRRLFATAVAGASVYATCTVLSAFVIRLVTDKLITPRFERGHVAAATVVGVLALLVAVALVRAAGVVVRRVWAGRTAWRVNERLTGEVVGRYVAQPAPWHRRQTTGDLISRAGLDAEAATTVLNPLPFASSVVVLLVISVVWMLATDVVLGLFALGLFPLLIGLNLVYQRRADLHYNTAQDELGKLSSAVHESFDGVTVVKALGAESRETERLAAIASRLRDARIRTVRIRSLFEALLDGVPNVANTASARGGCIPGSRRSRHRGRTGQLLLPVHLAGLPVAPDRIRPVGPAALTGWLEPGPWRPRRGRGARSGTHAQPLRGRCRTADRRALPLRR